MADIRAFQGIRYNSEVVGDVSKVVSPPYDIISPEDRIYYHQLHPNNFVRLILGEEFDTDSQTDNRFTRAKKYLDEWQLSGVLIKDSNPAIYLYEQQFERNGKINIIRGFTCLVKLQEYSDNIILPHENTLAKPKSALSELIRSTNANLDCVYGLYADEKNVLQNVINKTMNNPAILDVKDKDGVRHIIWATNNVDDVSIITNFMKDKQIAIADGHHRYETALAYKKETRLNKNCDTNNCKEIDQDFAIMTIVNVFEPDLTVLPTHRVINNLSLELVDDLLKKLSTDFNISESDKKSLAKDMAKTTGIGLYFKDKAYVLDAKSTFYDRLVGCDAARKLELNVLHNIILEPMLGIDREKLINQTNVTYTRSFDEAISLVDEGKAQLSFLLNEIEVKSILDIAAAGEKMPQKATYFYPKLLSGMIFRVMEN